MEESSSDGSDGGKLYYSFMPKNGTEDNSLKPDLGLGNTQTAEKKGIVENYGSGKHFIDIVEGVNFICM